MKKSLVVLIVVLILVAATTTVAFASDTISTPGQMISTIRGLTAGQSAQDEASYCNGQTTDAVTQEEFKAERLAQCKQRLDQAVSEGRITQEDADKIYTEMEQRMNSCLTGGNTNGQGSGCSGMDETNQSTGNSGNQNRGCGMMND